MAADKTFLDDAESLRALVAMMLPAARREYESYGALALESAFPNRRMVIYTLHGQKPVDIAMCKFGDIKIDRIRGPSFTVEVEPAQGKAQTYDISTVPLRIPGRDLFMHTPQNFILKWKGKVVPKNDVHFVPHYAVLIKTRSKEVHQVEGDTYCVTMNKFRERFPATDLRY